MFTAANCIQKERQFKKIISEVLTKPLPVSYFVMAGRGRGLCKAKMSV
jgi:hypothetical protein